MKNLIKKFNGISLYKKMITYIFVIGFISLFGILSLFVISINNTKNTFIEKFLNVYLNYNIDIGDNTLISLRTNNKITCETSLRLDLKSITTCSLPYTDINANKQNLGSLEKLEATLVSDLFDKNVIDFKSNGLKVSIKAKVADFNKKLLEGKSKDLLKKINGFDKISKNISLKVDFFVSPEKFIKDGTERFIDLTGVVLTDEFTFAQNLKFKFKTYVKPKFFKIKMTNENNVSTETKIFLPFEKITESKKILITMNNRELGLNLFYKYYLFSFEDSNNKLKFNQDYLNLNKSSAVDYKTFVKIVSSLTKIAASEYALSEDAPLVEAISHLFNGHLGSTYIINKKENSKDISSEYISELGKYDPEQADNLNRKHYNRKVVSCDNMKECLEEL